MHIICCIWNLNGVRPIQFRESHDFRSLPINQAKLLCLQKTPFLWCIWHGLYIWIKHESDLQPVSLYVFKEQTVETTSNKLEQQHWQSNIIIPTARSLWTNAVWSYDVLINAKHLLRSALVFSTLIIKIANCHFSQLKSPHLYDIIFVYNWCWYKTSLVADRKQAVRLYNVYNWYTRFTSCQWRQGLKKQTLLDDICRKLNRRNWKFSNSAYDNLVLSRSTCELWDIKKCN